MADIQIFDLTPENIADYGVCGYKDVKKHAALRNKIAWFETYYPKGLRIKALISQKGGYQGMIEYIPGEYAHRPVNAKGYMFIQCVFVGFKNEFKGQGFASLLIEACLEDARKANLKGVAVVTRKSSFMVGSDIFLKKDFQVVDRAEPDFSLLAKKFAAKSKNPRFRPDLQDRLKPYGKGLTILRSSQCPYTEKNVDAIVESAKTKYHLKTTVIDLHDVEEVQNVPCAFGTFCLIHDGQIISHHPISKGRFENIMKKIL